MSASNAPPPAGNCLIFSAAAISSDSDKLSIRTFLREFDSGKSWQTLAINRLHWFMVATDHTYAQELMCTLGLFSNKTIFR